MYLDYSKLEFDTFDRPETPVLLLQTLSNESLGTISGVHNLKFNIKYSEPSEISFEVPAFIDGEKIPLYDDITGHKLIYTKNYGIYVVSSVETSSDGISEIKTISGCSLENRLEDKRFYIEDGTFNFWNPVTPEDTILGRIMEIALDWSVGYVSPALVGKYRTFSSYDDYLLSFIYNTTPDIYRCVFVFDPYAKTINAYDIDETRNQLPIYLDFNNLLETVGVTELSDELVTAIRPYGSDGLDIRNVNPIGTNWIYNLDYFISNGDIPDDLAIKWNSWQQSILNNQEYYYGLIGMSASATSRLLVAKSELVDLNGELTDLNNQQNVTIQALALESTDAGKATQEALLAEINHNISVKKAEISNKEDEIKDIESEINGDIETSYSSQIKAIVSELSIFNYFTDEEYAILNQYLIEQDLTEDTFVATNVTSSTTGSAYSYDNADVNISDSELTQIDLSADYNKQMYTMTGGSLSVSGDVSMSCDIIRGTLEVQEDDSYVLTLYAGTLAVGDITATSGLLTMSGNIADFNSDITLTNENDLELLLGTYINFSTTSFSLFITSNVSDYQKYSVQMELYDFAVVTLKETSTPTYEFEISSGNFLFAKEFEPFREKLELGSSVYLNLGNGQVITPLIIEAEIDFESQGSFSMVFSNRFKRYDNVNTLSDMIESSYSSSRSFDANKYIYNQNIEQASAVSDFMSGSLDAAKNTILAASDQSVVIDGSGIHIGGTSDYQLRIVDSMIALTDNSWDSVKLAIGRFYSDEVGDYFGVNADVIGGKLIVGNNLVIENTNDTGVMQFKVDSTGAWLYNSTFLLQSDINHGGIIIDPKYGIVAGEGNLFTTSGTTVTPSFIDEDGNIVLDSDGMPENTNFFLDVDNGDAYFRGSIFSTSGNIGGWTLENDYLHSGNGSTFVALNASGSNNSSFAIWAGGSSPTSAPFAVKRDGTLTATFDGLTALDDNSWLIGCGIKVGRDSTATNGYNFYVSPEGDVTMSGDLKLSAGVITWSNLSTSVASTINTAQETAENAEDMAAKIADGKYKNGTFINGKEIFSPIITGAEFNVLDTSDAYGGINFYYNGSCLGGMSISNTMGDDLSLCLGTSRDIVFYPPLGDIYLSKDMSSSSRTIRRILTVNDIYTQDSADPNASYDILTTNDIGNIDTTARFG